MPKKPTISKLRKKAWSEFSTFIRLRDSDIFGMGKCSTCHTINMVFGTGKMCAGHFIPQKQCPPLVFIEDNVHLQCSYCNGPGMGQQYAMGDYIQQRWSASTDNAESIGQISPKEIYLIYIRHKKSSIPFRWTRKYLEELIEIYSNKNAGLLKEKSFALKSGKMSPK